MDSPTQPVRFVRPVEKRRRIPVAALMALSFGTLVFLSIGGVLALTVGANVRNTLDLLGAQSTLLVDAMEDPLRGEMERAENAVKGVAELYAQGEFQIDDDRAMSAVLSGALSGAGQATAMLICTPDLVCRASRARRTEKIEELKPEAEKSAQVVAALEQRRQYNRLLWGFVRGQRAWPVRQSCRCRSPAAAAHRKAGRSRGSNCISCPRSPAISPSASARTPSSWMAKTGSSPTSG